MTAEDAGRSFVRNRGVCGHVTEADYTRLMAHIVSRSLKMYMRTSNEKSAVKREGINVKFHFKIQVSSRQVINLRTEKEPLTGLRVCILCFQGRSFQSLGGGRM